MLKIGSVILPEKIIAAPLAGISNPVYRKMCHEYGAGMAVSEMISDKALHYHNVRTYEMCAVDESEHPCALQLFGSEPETMAEAAEYLTANTACDVIDINMGCPVTKVVKAHSGSWLLGHPQLAYDIIKAVKNHTDRPVTVKIRAGWDASHITCVQIAQLAEKAGADAIAVHGRTRSQMYSGQSDNRYIRMVKEAVSIPVIGNGDIKTCSDAQKMMEETGCDGIMIGRGLLGRPWFLTELKAYFAGESFELPDFQERLRLAYDYAEKLCAYQTEYTGIRMMRTMAAWYIAGMPYASQYKNLLCQAETLADMKKIFDEYSLLLKEQ